MPKDNSSIAKVKMESMDFQEGRTNTITTAQT